MKKLIIILFILIVLIGGGTIYVLMTAGKVTIAVNPSDAVVKIDDLQVGTGSVETTLKYGKHTVEVTKDNYTTRRQSIFTWVGKPVNLTIALAAWPAPVKVSDNVTTVAMDENGENLLISGDGGTNFYKQNVNNGQKTAISKLNFGKAVKVKWSPNRFLAFILRNDGSAGMADLKRYDLVNQQFTVWGKGYLDLAWSADNSQVAYIYKPGTGEFSLKTADPGNLAPEIVYDLNGTGITNPSLEWTPDGKQLIIIDKDIYSYTLYTHQFQRLTTSGDVGFGRLTPDGQAVVYSTASGFNKVELTGKKSRIGEAAQLFGWTDDKKSLVVFRGGELLKNDLSGHETAFGYIGDRLGAPQALFMPKGDATVYLLINNQITGLFLQPKVTASN